MRSFVLMIICGLALVRPAAAATITTTVIGTDMPWNWVNLALNTSEQFGINDGTSPDVISAASGFNFAAGNMLTLTYLSGTVAVGTSFPAEDAKGDIADSANNGTGSTGKVFPSFYMSSSTYPINLGELVGTFATSTGAIVGTPFVVGDGPTVLIDPVRRNAAPARGKR